MNEDEDSGISWEQIVKLIFMIAAIIALLLFVTMAFILPVITE